MTNSALLAAISQTIRTYKSKLDRHRLSVCVVYRQAGADIHTSYCAGSYDAGRRQGDLLEQRASELLSERDITPDCCLIETWDNTVVGVVIGGQADISTQAQLAPAIAANIATRYKELCR